jgi:polysaccharide deacetylase family protein (PEP-CTERM system associated)
MNVCNTIVITVDVEDWFQVENLRKVYPKSSWECCPQRVVQNTRAILDLLDHYKVRGTFFVLGWLAERNRGLIREIHERGHEVASHGYGHELCSTLSKIALDEDLHRSKALLEDITGEKVVGYRAPAFSITDTVMDALFESGYQYDSSWNATAVSKRYGRLEHVHKERGGVCYVAANGLLELPISNLLLCKRAVPWGGGGYFRFWPPELFKWGVSRIIRDNGCYLFYLHPWEIDAGQPRVHQISPLARFRHYKNLSETLARMSDFLSSFQNFSWMGCKSYLERNCGLSSC